MRVLVNQSTALGAKSGIGHYTLALLDALRALAPMDEFDVFPPRWWQSFRKLGSALRPTRTSAAKASLLGPLRNVGERALAGYLGLTTTFRSLDLYHEATVGGVYVCIRHPIGPGSTLSHTC